MHTKNLYSLVLAGGSGTRLWPLSREEMPKQFLAVCGMEHTLLQQTVVRLRCFSDVERMKIVASGKWRDLIHYQLEGVGLKEIALVEEPEARNTAPAIALGLRALLREGADENDFVLVCPSDHLIWDEEAFARTLEIAIKASAAGNLVTFGIAPTSPETGFGYIRVSIAKGGWLSVDAFVEKPDRGTAEAYLRSGGYYWNGGIFCFRISDMMNAYSEHFPECAEIFRADDASLGMLFQALPGQSVDYAIMEKARNIACVPLDAGWSDVGSWDAVFENSPRDSDNNAIMGNVVLSGGKDNLVVGDDRLVCGVDLEAMIVVDTPDALFIAPRGASDKLRSVVKDLSAAKPDRVAEAPMSARPWGTYRVLSKGGRHKIKRIVVSPGKRLSMQYHLHRSEHWVVVQGTAKATLCDLEDRAGAEEILVHEGESIFVPKGKLHRLENPGKIPLEIIEVQIGEYIGEDDICRTADDFSRLRNLAE